jgi:hypothetical protein
MSDEQERNRRLADRIADGKAPLDANMIRVAREMGAANLDVPGPRVVQIIDELEQLRAQRAAVLAIHQREDSYVCGGSCSYCRDSDEDPVKWPCPTAKALGVTS